METLDTVGYSEDISLCSWNVLTAALHQRDIYRQLERYVYTSKYQVTFTRLPGTPPIPATTKTPTGRDDLQRKAVDNVPDNEIERVREEMKRSWLCQTRKMK